MSYSSGRCHHLVFNLSFLFFLLVPKAVGGGGGGGYVDGGDIMSIVSSASREEMVELAGYGEDRLSTVLVIGSVVCQACSAVDDDQLHHQQLHEWPVPGAVLAVNCRTKGKKKHMRPTSAQTVTDEYGDFTIDLPSELHGIANIDKSCCVQVTRMPKDSSCKPAYVHQHKALKLSSLGNGIRSYSAGKIQFMDTASKPLQTCGKTKTTHSSKKGLEFLVTRVTEHKEEMTWQTLDSGLMAPQSQL